MARGLMRCPSDFDSMQSKRRDESRRGRRGRLRHRESKNRYRFHRDRLLVRLASAMVTILFTSLFSQLAESQNVRVPLQPANMRRMAPRIVDLDKSFKPENVLVGGISMDVSYEGLKNAKEGWDRVIPFVRAHHIPYTVLMGDKDVETN